MTRVATWGTTTVGDLMRLKYGKALEKDRRDPQGNFPVVGSAGVMSGTQEPLVARPVVLIGRKGNVGQVQFFDAGCWPIDTTYYAEIPTSVDARFLLYQLRFADLRKLDSSTATPSLRRQDLEAVQLLLPPLAEQLRIVEILEDHLSRIDAADAQMRAALLRLDTLDRSIHQLALRGELVLEDLSSGTGRELVGSATLLDHEVLDERAWPVPDDWAWVRLGDVFLVSVGSTPPRGDARLWDGSVPWVSSGEVAFNRIKSTRESISRAAVISTKRVHPPGTVMLAMIGEGKTRGQAAILDIEAAHNQNCASIRVSETAILPEYVYAFLKERYLETRRGSSGGNQPALNKRRIQVIPIPIPPLGTQRRIVAELDRMAVANNYLRDSLTMNLARSGALRRATLSAAFEGMLTGRNRDDDVIAATDAGEG